MTGVRHARWADEHEKLAHHGTFGQLTHFIGALGFYLIYQERIRTTLVTLFHDRDMRLEVLRTLECIDEHMATYFSTCTLVNAGVGVGAFLAVPVLMAATVSLERLFARSNPSGT